MNDQKISPFFRPLVGAAIFIVAYCTFLIWQEGRIFFDRVGIVAALAVVSAALLGIVQSIIKKRFDWIGSVVGVIGLTLIVGVIAVAIRTGQIVGP